MNALLLKNLVYTPRIALKLPASLLKPVLVLNRNSQPINMATVTRSDHADQPFWGDKCDMSELCRLTVGR